MVIRVSCHGLFDGTEVRMFVGGWGYEDFIQTSSGSTPLKRPPLTVWTSTHAPVSGAESTSKSPT
jgi:hypothetical protein